MRFFYHGIISGVKHVRGNWNLRFAKRLKQLRKELNLTQSDLANACNVKLTFFSKYENEIVKPSFDMLSKIALAYNVNLNWLVNGFGTMFIETAERRLIKDATNGFYVETVENPELVSVRKDTHSLELTNDLKVEYYGLDNCCTKIYHKNGELEYYEENTESNKLKVLQQRLAEICHDSNKYEFIMTALNSLYDENSLQELKTLIKGMELSKK